MPITNAELINDGYTNYPTFEIAMEWITTGNRSQKAFDIARRLGAKALIREIKGWTRGRTSKLLTGLRRNDSYWTEMVYAASDLVNYDEIAGYFIDRLIEDGELTAAARTPDVIIDTVATLDRLTEATIVYLLASMKRPEKLRHYGDLLNAVDTFMTQKMPVSKKGPEDYIENALISWVVHFLGRHTICARLMAAWNIELGDEE